MNMSLKLNNGVTIPALGFGVFQTAPEDTAHIVRTALDTGYRHIDTAAAYLNEAGVGEGIRQSGIPREDIFIESKVWVSEYGFDATLHAFEKSSRKIGFEVIDLLLLHQPMPQHFDRTREAYRALEKLLEEGRVRSIGVSNFLPRHVDELMKSASVIPAVNQSELHPYFSRLAESPSIKAQKAIERVF